MDISFIPASAHPTYHQIFDVIQKRKQVTSAFSSREVGRPPAEILEANMRGALLIIFFTVLFGIVTGAVFTQIRLGVAVSASHGQITELNAEIKGITSKKDSVPKRLAELRKKVESLSLLTVELAEELKRESKASAPQKAPASYFPGADVATVIRPSANLREAPSTAAKVISEVKEGSKLLVIEASGEWLKTLTPKGEQAWVSASLVRYGAV